ncbi:MFS family permease [Microbacterium ginsengiterrae]|uniref:MFS family permease n=1 Tax=Microbacterium ginsengiterrae TaxID=546115 RepID=A0A7W9CC11_9MICO|nr:MFS transporter [Microbacterium ginsengiterrae]MBB5742819.1 MFS family permease [Microbacterium ginsengiterrae]
MTSTTTPAHSLAHNGRYITWLVSDTAKGLASALFSFAIPLIALFATDDPAQAGVISAVGMTIRTLTTLYGGVLADRHARIRMMVTGSVVGVALSVAFTALALTDALTFVALLVIEILLAARTGLFDVAGESALKEIVPGDAMGRAQGANQGRDAVLQLAGGPLGGALLAAGAWAIGAAMAVCHVVAAATAWMLQRSAPHEAAPSAETEPDAAIPETGVAAAATTAATPNARREIAEGFRWLFSRADLRGVLFVATIINLGFSAALTTVMYALQQQGHSPLTIGLLGTGAGVAMLLGALVAPLLVSRIRAGAVIIGGLAVSTIAIFGLIPFRSPLLLGLILAAAVVFIPAVNAALMGYFMVATPTEMLGRANSAAAVLGMGAMPLAPLVAGIGLSFIGRETTLVVGAALCAIAVLLAVSNAGLRALPAESAWAAHAAQFARR